MDTKLKILHLEDMPSDAELVGMELKRSKLLYEKIVVDNRADYIKALNEYRPDIVLSDHSLPSFNSIEAFEILKKSDLNIPFILITATISEEFAVDIMKDGASDYILKDRMQRLPNAIVNALEKFRLEAERQRFMDTQTAILNALPPNIVLINETGKIIAVNESWKKLALLNNLGMPNYGVGYNYLAISEKATGVDKINGGKIEQGISDVIQGNKKIFTLEYASLTGNVWFQAVVAPLADKAHKGAVILHIDITDRKLAEASLLQSEANLRSVFENIDLCIILFDTSLKIVSFNSHANEAMFRHFNKKLKTGNTAFNYFPKEDRAGIKKAIQLVTEQKVVSYETTYPLPGGGFEWYDIKWVGVVGKNGGNVGVILTFRNITEKKNTEIERENMTADLAQRNKDLEQFTYIISHNLRAPVANIQGLAALLGDFKPDQPESLDTLQALSVSVNNLDKVILDLNHILQIRSQVNDQIELVSLPLLLNEIRAGISQMIIKNKVTLTYNFDEIREVYILKSYLYSIFQNLVINSIKYRRPDADPVITISSKVKDNRIFIYFKDNCKGIDLDKYGSHLFGLYKRFDWSVEGKGVGLFMVKMQVESLGGTISVKSELNVGTEFTLEFPVAMKQLA